MLEMAGFKPSKVTTNGIADLCRSDRDILRKASQSRQPGLASPLRALVLRSGPSRRTFERKLEQILLKEGALSQWKESVGLEMR